MNTFAQTNVSFKNEEIFIKMSATATTMSVLIFSARIW